MADEDKRRCPSCKSSWVVCAIREGTIGSFCCGDCDGSHDRVAAAERRAAARARVAADRKRGVLTPDWIAQLAKNSSARNEELA